MDSSIISRLTGALADRYRVDAELGAGVDWELCAGNSNTAHPTRDLEHDRAGAGMVLRADDRH